MLIIITNIEGYLNRCLLDEIDDDNHVTDHMTFMKFGERKLGI